jgi:hypothetical protein
MDCFRYILKLAKTLELKSAANILCILLHRQISGMRKRKHRMRIRLLSLQDDQLEMVLEAETRAMWYLALQHCFSNYGYSSSQCALWGFGRRAG